MKSTNATLYRVTLWDNVDSCYIIVGQFFATENDAWDFAEKHYPNFSYPQLFVEEY